MREILDFGQYLIITHPVLTALREKEEREHMMNKKDFH